ncbi:glycosyltransferase [Gaetbulibacter sp. M240]|uniref:glycosyltransferase n=1 Tax=Gaetbulibacter sp. M240 TaxID=3126511 RepID=UPI00374EA14C
MESLVLSIVVPVFNVSQYVEKCIRSCFNQNIPLSSFEVIIVNDGSTDNSLAICENLKKEFKSLKIISQDNKGLSGARNTGLKNATGKYVWFVDSDDWIEENCLKLLFEQIKLHDIDLFWIGHEVIVNGVPKREYIPDSIKNLITGEELFIKHLNNLFYIWKFIYKRDFLIKNKLWFYEGILFEDLEFTPRVLIEANKCQIIPKSFYNYLIRSGSIASINNIKNKSINDRLHIIDKLSGLTKSDNISSNFEKELKEIIIDSFIKTIKMSSRGRLELPFLAFDLINKFKIEKYVITSNKFDFYLVKNNLKIYHFFFKMIYTLSSKIKIK